MTRIVSITSALLVVAALTAAPAQAGVAAGDTELSPGGVERACAFVAEAGGYVCENFDVGGSLSDLQDGNGKKKKKYPGKHFI